MSTRSRFLLLLAGLLLSGCSSLPFFGDDEEDGVDVPEDVGERELYDSAQRALRGSNYDDAIQRLQLLEARYPFGRYAEQAQLELIYAYFKGFQPDAARSAADRFIRLHPQHPNVDYAYYLKGLAAFEKDQGALTRFMSTDLAARDIGSARESFVDFSQLVARYPTSPYAADARQRMIYLRNLLARSEILIGRYYMSRDAFVAAANRGRNVVENYPSTPYVADGLSLMIEAYLRLNMPEPANDALRILVANYPDYEALNERGEYVIQPSTQNRDRSWLNIATFGLIDDPETPPPLQVQVPGGVETMPQREPAAPDTEASEESEDESGWRRWIPFL